MSRGFLEELSHLVKLREGGVSQKLVQSLRSPTGADMGAVTPMEIALSIMAEVVATKYGKSIPTKSLGRGFKACRDWVIIESGAS